MIRTRKKTASKYRIVKQWAIYALDRGRWVVAGDRFASRSDAAKVVVAREKSDAFETMRRADGVRRTAASLRVATGDPLASYLSGLADELNSQGLHVLAAEIVERVQSEIRVDRVAAFGNMTPEQITGLRLGMVAGMLENVRMALLRLERKDVAEKVRGMVDSLRGG